MRNLDELDLAKLDPDSMWQRIGELPQQCLDAWALVESFRLPESYRQVNNVVISGLGGSAIGADLARTLAQASASVPIAVVRDYSLPDYVDDRTLAIASSYSGNTEETLAVLDEAIARGAKCVGVGTGGLLQQRCQDAGIPFLRFDYKSAPRAALGYSLFCLAGVLYHAGLLPMAASDLNEAVQVMRAWQQEITVAVPTADNAAKQLAMRIYGHLPVIYGASILSEVARRWKGQFNENSKSWSFFEVMPELNHNAVLGYQNPGQLTDRILVIMLRSQSDHPRVQIRFDITAQILAEHKVSHETVWARGNSPLAQMLSIIHFGDYVSLYLAFLYGSDPTAIDAINYLKSSLARA